MYKSFNLIFYILINLNLTVASSKRFIVEIFDHKSNFVQKVFISKLKNLSKNDNISQHM